MIEEVFPGLYRIEVPLPNNPLKATNAYFVRGDSRSLIIDTGMNRPECREALFAAVRRLNINLRQTDLFVTHLHADHLGLASFFASNGASVYFNRPDAELMTTTGFWSVVQDRARQNGFPESELHNAINHHPGYKYSMPEPVRFTLVQEGDRLPVGEYEFECVDTPGHTWGHICLYEPRRKIFVSGDHILGAITPNISVWSDRDNPLKTYLASLDKMQNYAVDIVLPGHRSLIHNCGRRIQELKEHHRARLEEVLSILEDGPGSAYAVASQMSWDIVASSWEDYPVAQKWFATGEALAHLRYLEEEGSLQGKTNPGGVLEFHRQS